MEVVVAVAEEEAAAVPNGCGDTGDGDDAGEEEAAAGNDDDASLPCHPQLRAPPQYQESQRYPQRGSHYRRQRPQPRLQALPEGQFSSWWVISGYGSTS